ncbi:anti-sigma factor family protein [Indioceanicola profundi]|uniref:anti-sigma factor family protein n=1 Tax=Indioceanicola profundi TaxID=2220096 RepID=UPI000E6AE21F|nr:anti-sigma factor [Indioceanicola profundi]
MNKQQGRPASVVVWPERLVAYVDGELPPELVAEVEASIAADPRVQAMVEDLRRSRVLLRAAFADSQTRVADTAAPARRRSVSTRRRSVVAGLAVAAAIVLILSVRAGPLPGTPSSEIAYLHEEVAAYHTVYMTETEHLVEVPASRQGYIEHWLGGRLERPLQVPDLENAGFSFAGARLMTLGTAPVAQLMYRAEGRLPIAVCVTKAEDGDRPPISDSHHGLSVASWVESGQTFVVVGTLDERELSLIVDTIRPAVGT